jgi:uncharacterized membrane protein YgcG
MLAAKGADPRVILDDTSKTTPEQYVATLQKECPSWQSASGGVKNNLIVFLVFPKRHAAGLFVGNEFGRALNTSVIRTQFMAPAFRDGDWTRGMIAGMSQAAVQIEAFQTAALHPATTVITKQATDMSGLWRWLDWLLGAILLGCCVIGILALFNFRRKRLLAQQQAVLWRNEAAGKIINSTNYALSEEFSRLNQSETFNPDTKGLDIEEYEEIGKRYKWIADKVDAEVAQASRKFRFDRSASRHSGDGHSTAPAGNPDPDVPKPGPTPPTPPQAAPAASPSVTNTTIINKAPARPAYIDDGYYGPSPVIVPIIEPVFVPEPEPVAVREESSSSWNDSSSSSSFDDSSSSSFSDSSSSSGFDDSSSSSFSDSSSSSDFGGGDSGSFGGDSGSF